ncbi:AEX-3 domain-containing protein [Blastocladiella britannica]|nr:AEX-3 domain-containing protein [Blastocladiella britannica]
MSNSSQPRLVSYFFQVGLPPDGRHLSKVRIAPEWSNDDMRARTLLVAPGAAVSESEPLSRGLLLDTDMSATSAPADNNNGDASEMTSADMEPSRTTATNASARQPPPDMVLSPRHGILSQPPELRDPCNIPLPISPSSSVLSLNRAEPGAPCPAAPLPPWPDASARPALTMSTRPTEMALTSLETGATPKTPWSPEAHKTVPRKSSAGQNGKAVESCKAKSPHPVEYTYLAQVIDSYPRLQHHCTNAAGRQQGQIAPPGEWLQHLPMFVYPDHIRIVESPHGPPPSTAHSFALTKEDGTKLHCSSLIFWERPSGGLAASIKYACRAWYVKNMTASDLEYLAHLRNQIARQRTVLAQDGMDSDERAVAEDKLKLFVDLLAPYATNACVDVTKLYVPRAMVLVSGWPVYDLMEDWIKATYKSVTDNAGSNVSLEAALVNLIAEVPMPPPGRKEVAIVAGSSLLHFSRPAPNEIPMIKNFSLYPLFRALSIENIVFLLECHPSLLHLAIQSISMFMFPFNWFHVSISVLPLELIGYLEAPVPYMIGILSKHVALIGADVLADDLVLVDLDKSTITSSLRTPPAPLPLRRRAKFVSRLRASYPVAPASPPALCVEAFPLGKLVLHTTTPAASIPPQLRDRIGLSDPDLLGYANFHEAAAPADSKQGSSVAAGGRSSQAQLAGSHYFGGSGVSEKSGGLQSVTPSIISAAPSTSRFSIFRRPSAISTSKGIGSGSSPSNGPVTPSPTTLTAARVIEGHNFSAHARGAWARCSECDGADTPAAPIARCLGCGVHAHLDCARSGIVAWCTAALDEARVRRSALKLWVSVMRGYRAFIRSNGTLDSNGWLADGCDADARPFMRAFMETQAFAMFIQDRTGGGSTMPDEDSTAQGPSVSTAAVDTEIIFFDESVKLKRGKFVAMTRGADTSFFKDQSFAVTSVYNVPPPHSSDVQKTHEVFPFISEEILDSIPVRHPESLISPQEELMLALYTAKMIRQAKRAALAARGSPTSATVQSPTTAAGGVNEWFRRYRTSAAVAPGILPLDATDGGSGGVVVGTASSDGGAAHLARSPSHSVGPTPPTPNVETIRRMVEDQLSRAWDTLKDPVFSQPVRSRDDHALRQAKLLETGRSLNELLLNCEQSDLDDIIAITCRIDNMVTHLDEEFHSIFLDEAVMNRLMDKDIAPPTLSVRIPSLDFSEFEIQRSRGATRASRGASSQGEGSCGTQLV